MHVSLGCLFDEWINSAAYHELFSLTKKSLKALVKKSLIKPANGSQRQNARRWIYKEFRLLELLPLSAISQTAGTSVLDTLKVSDINLDW